MGRIIVVDLNAGRRRRGNFYEDCLELALNHSLAIVLPSIERLQLKTGGPFSPDADTSRGFLGPFVLDTAMTLPI